MVLVFVVDFVEFGVEIFVVVGGWVVGLLSCFGYRFLCDWISIWLLCKYC